MSDLPEEAEGPRAIDLVHELHRAVYGDSWDLPETPRAVWADLLAKVREMPGVPDPEPEWVPKVGDWCRRKDNPSPLPLRIVDITNGYVAWHGRDGQIPWAPFAGWRAVDDLPAEYEPCDPPEWWAEVDTSASPGQAEAAPSVPWAALQNAIFNALSPFSLGARGVAGHSTTRVADLLEAHGVEITDKPEEA